MYDSLWESHPRVKQLRAEIAASKAEVAASKAEVAASKAEIAASKARFEIQGEIHGLQHAIVTFVRVRYPNLTTMAQQKVAHLNKPDALSFLFEQIAAQTTEDGVRALLIPTVA